VHETLDGFTDCNGALRAIALGVCDYLADTTGCPTRLVRMSLDGSIILVIEGMFKEGVALHGTASGVDSELLATTAAWAVFGAARRWLQTTDLRSRSLAIKLKADIAVTRGEMHELFIQWMKHSSQEECHLSESVDSCSLSEILR